MSDTDTKSPDTKPEDTKPEDTKPSGKAAAAAPKKKAAKVEPLPRLDPNVPPLFVRHKPTGRITNWSTLFKKNLADYEVYYRPDTDDRFKHTVARRRYEAKQSLRDDPYAGARGSAFSGDFDGEDGL